MFTGVNFGGLCFQGLKYVDSRLIVGVILVVDDNPSIREILEVVLAASRVAGGRGGVLAEEVGRLVILGVRNGIEHWDHDKAVAAVMKYTKKLSVTIHDWMMPYTILGMTKVSREQGEWAGLTAARILGGAKPTDIPVVPNRQRDVWINTKILSASGLQLPQELMRKGKKIAELAR